MVHAKIKWYGIGNFAYPYLWKENKLDAEYKESWNDPRKPKVQKEDKKQIERPQIKKDKGRRI